MASAIALLRGINVSGRNKIPMAGLRALAEAIGVENPRTYIQSGNLAFASKEKPAALESALETAIHERFGLEIPVVVRTARQWKALLAKSPTRVDDPKLLMLALAKKKLAQDVVAQLQERARADEEIVRTGEALWIRFPAGVAKTKLTPAVLDRAAGSSVTMRNLRTVAAITALLDDG